MPFSGALLTTRSATGSPPESRGLSRRISAPISLRMSITPVRVGFTPTWGRVSSLSSAMEAPTRKNAAEEMSAGTSRGPAASGVPPVTVLVAPSRRTGTPKPPSIRSVWSRVGAGSVTEVSPSAYRPASNTADFTWADAIGSG